MARNVYPKCAAGPQPANIECLEGAIGSQITRAMSCEFVKKLKRRADYLPALATKGNVSGGVANSREVKGRLDKQACDRLKKLACKLPDSCLKKKKKK